LAAPKILAFGRLVVFPGEVTARIKSVARICLWLTASNCFACQEKKAEPIAAAPTERPPPADTSFRYPAAERVVAIGDLHGDALATREALKLAGALGGDDHWAGGRLVVVQTGDQLDRGDDEPEILDLLERLAEEAKAAGGALHVLNGNHEVMNVQGDFRYVTEDGFRDFSATPAGEQHARELGNFAGAQRGRAVAFLSGGTVARRLAKRSSVIQVGDSVFVHGGLLERHVRYGLGRINREISAWMQAPETRRPPAMATDQQGPLWLRTYSDGLPSRQDCEALERVLAGLAARRLVVGHTVQRSINSACNQKVWRIDVGMARAYGNRPSVLEIAGGRTRVLEAAAPSAASAKATPSAASASGAPSATPSGSAKPSGAGR
jgi:hypothetical protein